MVKNAVSLLFILCLLLLARPSAVAGTTKPVCDTLPGNNKTPEEANTKKNEEPIKEVPKSRKQDKPVAVNAVTVKPVLVKPKIIVKPTIKVHL